MGAEAVQCAGSAAAHLRAVLSEASFLLQRAGADQSLPVTLVGRGVLRVEQTVTSEAESWPSAS